MFEFKNLTTVILSNKKFFSNLSVERKFNKYNITEYSMISFHYKKLMNDCKYTLMN